MPCWGKPQTPKARAKNGTRFARVFSKAKKLTVVNFHEIRYRKSGFQRGNKRTFFMPLVDTRSLIQYKTNIITYGKKHDSILAYADAP